MCAAVLGLPILINEHAWTEQTLRTKTLGLLEKV